MAGSVVLCPTPIGNLEDVTLRALRMLREADVIACEDTRHTLRLLTHFDIRKPLISLHQHNWKERAPGLVARAAAGELILVVSDAGTPGISDPGMEICALAVEAGVRVEALPGASAALVALVGSGLYAERFAFEGFLPRDKNERRQRIQGFLTEERTLILYEAPHRMKRTLEELTHCLGPERGAVLARELTKVYEEYIRGTLADLLARAESGLKGECVLILAPVQKMDVPNPTDADVLAALETLKNKGLDKKTAIAQVALDLKVPKKMAYGVALTMDW